MANGELQPSRNPKWLQVDDEEILLGYNAEMRGIANYYALASGAKQGLNKLMYLAESSFLKTLANKHDTTASKIASKLRQGNDFIVTTYTKERKPRRHKLFKLRNWKPSPLKDEVDAMPLTGTYLRSQLVTAATRSKRLRILWKRRGILRGPSRQKAQRRVWKGRMGTNHDRKKEENTDPLQ